MKEITGDLGAAILVLLLGITLFEIIGWLWNLHKRYRTKARAYKLIKRAKQILKNYGKSF